MWWLEFRRGETGCLFVDGEGKASHPPLLLVLSPTDPMGSQAPEGKRGDSRRTPVSVDSLLLAGSRARCRVQKRVATLAGLSPAAAAAASKRRSTAAVPETPAEPLLRGRPSSWPGWNPRRGCAGTGTALARRGPTAKSKVSQPQR